VRNTPPSIKTIGLLVNDDMQALDLTGPLDVFGAASTLAGTLTQNSKQEPLTS